MHIKTQHWHCTSSSDVTWAQHTRVLEIIKKCKYVNFDLLLPSTLNAPLVTSGWMDDIGEYDLKVKTVDGSPSVFLIRKTTGKSHTKDFKSGV